MTGFKVNNFGGVIPRLGSRLLPKEGAQTAQNVKLFSGELSSWLRTTLVNTPTKGGSLKSMFRMYSTSTDYWLAWTDDVDVVKGPIAGDTAFKIYYTGDTTTATNSAAGPRKTNLALATTGGTDYPHDYLEMGVPAPGSPPLVIGTGGTATTSVTRVYLYTYVTNTASWAEEGPPSALGTGTGKSDAGWVISGLSTGTTGKYAFSGGIKRIYRALTDSAGNTNYQLALDNVPMATTSTGDAVADGNLGVICPTFAVGVLNSEWVAPPADLSGIIALPNGIMAGFSKNLICFSEPFYPHAWPIRYRLATNFDIISIGFFGQTMIVTTKGFPYAVIGARPDAMSMARIEENHPCVSKRSTVSFPFGVAWATPDGLALAGVGGTLNVIEPFMKRDEWRAQCFPETLIAHQFQNTYFGFFNNGSVGLNFVFDRTNQQGPLTFGNYDVQGAWNDPESSKLYLLQNGAIYQWDADSLNKSPFDWKSKTFVFANPLNFGAIQVEADYAAFNDSGAVNAQIAADLAVNTSILGTGEAETAPLTAWAATSSYGTGAIRKSVDGVKMIICTVSGTSSTVEPTYPSTLGGTATDGTVRWKRIWEIQGVTKGDLRGHLVRGYIQQNSTDTSGDGPAGNRWGFPLRGSLLVGGTYANYDTRSLLLQVYAITTVSTSTGKDTTLVSSQYLTGREPVRLPRGFKSDTWEIRLSGNINVRYFKIAETMNELGRIE
jgi:hypothetical protein